MVLFLMAVAGVAVLLFPSLEEAFRVNVALNGLILGVLFAGVVFIFRQVIKLFRELRWLRAVRVAEGPTERVSPEPVLLAPLANILGQRTRKGALSLSAPAMRSLLDGLSARLDESREISRYLISLLIFLGLLGTFWGLLQTIHSVGGVIGTLSMEGNDVALMFGNLQKGLQAPLTGMGSAFSASLFGLAGSLVLGFLELQATQAQNLFFQDVEDWLSGVTKLSGGSGLGDGEQSVPAYLEALLEQTAENLDTLQRTITRSEEERQATNTNLQALTEKLATLSDQMRAEQTLMLSLAESFVEMRPLVARLTEALGTNTLGFDENSRQHVRNMDLLMARLVEEVSSGRTKAVQEIRGDIRLIARTIAALAEDHEQR
jgi:hypothetical protein